VGNGCQHHRHRDNSGIKRGDRTIGTLDPGIVAVAMMLTAVAHDFD